MTAASPGGDPCELCWTTWTGRCPFDSCPRKARPAAPPGILRLLPVIRTWPALQEPTVSPTLADVYGDGTLEELLR